jgi:hypothetical protein
VLEPGKTLALGGLLREERAERGSGSATRAAADESLLLVTAEIE